MKATYDNGYSIVKRNFELEDVLVKTVKNYGYLHINELYEKEQLLVNYDQLEIRNAIVSLLSRRVLGFDTNRHLYVVT